MRMIGIKLDHMDAPGFCAAGAAFCACAYALDIRQITKDLQYNSVPTLALTSNELGEWIRQAFNPPHSATGNDYVNP